MESFPKRTDEILVVHVTPDICDVVGLFTHDLFDGDMLNRSYTEYNEAVNLYLKRKLPEGGYFIGGPGGGLQNAAGSSIDSTFWQIGSYRTLRYAESDPNGLEGFTIKLYRSIFSRQPSYVKPVWEVADEGHLLIRDKKNKHDFWMERNGRWKGEQWNS